MDLRDFIAENQELSEVTAKDIKIPTLPDIKNMPAIVGKIEINPTSTGGLQMVVPLHYPAIAPEAERKNLYMRINVQDASWFNGSHRDFVEGSKEQSAYRMSIGRFYRPLLQATGATLSTLGGQTVLVSAKDKDGGYEVSGIYPYKGE